MNALIYPFLVVLGFILGYVCCMHDFDKKLTRDLDSLKSRDNGCGKEED